MPRASGVPGLWLVLGAMLAAGCAESEPRSSSIGLSLTPWVSRAIGEARGDIVVLPDGKRQAVRYAGWTRQDFGPYRTYAYADTRPVVPLGKALLPAIAGDPQQGRRLFLDRSRGPCTG